ncbi:sigma factor [Pedobacter sp. GR22-6]|uniref:sigma factor n=1 Tax=Pedobacter sp. GR22-6 TaxID=3127957 RepID=UPI00307F3C6C
MEISTLNYLICMEKPTLEVFALRFVKDIEQAEELVQDTIIRALQDSSTYTPGSNLKAWLYSLMKTVHLESNPEPIISIEPFKKRKMLSLDDIQLGSSELRVDKKELLAQVNRSLKHAINAYSKDLRDFQKASAVAS